MNTNIIKYSLLLSLVFQGTAFAQITEPMKSTLKEMVRLADKDQIQSLLTGGRIHQVVSVSDFPRPEQSVFDNALKKYPELDNFQDRIDLMKFISKIRQESHSSSNAAGHQLDEPCGSNSALPPDAGSLLASAEEVVQHSTEHRPATLPGNKSPINGSWKISGENAIFTIHDATATMTTSYHGCTEIIHLAATYPSPGKIVLSSTGPWTTVPAGCTGGSAPFSEGNLDYTQSGNDIAFNWHYTFGGGGSSPSHARRQDKDTLIEAAQAQLRSSSSQTTSRGSQLASSSCQNPRASQRTQSGDVTFNWMGQTYSGPRGMIHEMGNGDRVVASPYEYSSSSGSAF